MQVAEKTLGALLEIGSFLDGGGAAEQVEMPKAEEIPCKAPGNPAGACFPPHSEVEHFNFWGDRCGLCSNCTVLKGAAEDCGIYMDSPRK